MPDVKLTPMQEAFVREYLVDLNATAAAERAGYGGGKGGAAVAGSRLLRMPKVAALVAQAQAKRAEKVELTAERVLEELKRLVLLDPGSMAGSYKSLADMPEDLRRCIASFKVRTGDDGTSVTEVRFWDKTKAFELAMRHLGMLRDKVELSGEGGEPLQIIVQTYKEGEK